MEENHIIRALAGLAQVVRLRAYRALVVAGEQGLTPGVLAEQLGVPGNALSFHLKELAHAGLIEAQRQGRNLVYRADFALMHQVLAYLTENCCQGVPCAPHLPPSSTTPAGACAPCQNP